MDNKNYRNRNYSFAENREGAFEYDLKRLYDLFTKKSCVVYRFHERENEERFFELSFYKFECSPKEAKQMLAQYLTGYGRGPFNLNVGWRKGFGNSITIDVFDVSDEQK